MALTQSCWKKPPLFYWYIILHGHSWEHSTSFTALQLMKTSSYLRKESRRWVSGTVINTKTSQEDENKHVWWTVYLHVPSKSGKLQSKQRGQSFQLCGQLLSSSVMKKAVSPRSFYPTNSAVSYTGLRPQSCPPTTHLKLACLQIRHHRQNPRSQGLEFSLFLHIASPQIVCIANSFCSKQNISKRTSPLKPFFCAVRPSLRARGAQCAGSAHTAHCRPQRIGTTRMQDARRVYKRTLYWFYYFAHSRRTLSCALHVRSTI